jgi:hypothetical protein
MKFRPRFRTPSTPITAKYGQGIWDDIKATTNKALDYTDATFAKLWKSATSWLTE